MALENHDRLDKVLHTEEYMGMKCGSFGYVRKVLHEGSGQGAGGAIMVPGPDGQPLMEKKYCGVDCPTLKADHKAEK